MGGKGKAWKFGMRDVQRVWLLAVLAFVLQSTLPFLTRICPLEQPVVSIGHMAMADASAMPADCPMQATPAATASTPDKSTGHGKHPAFCPLCNALSPFNGYLVFASMAAVPSPACNSDMAFVPEAGLVATALRTCPFSARAPPFIA